MNEQLPRPRTWLPVLAGLLLFVLPASLQAGPTGVAFTAAAQAGRHDQVVKTSLSLLRSPHGEAWLVEALAELDPMVLRWVLPVLGSHARQPETAEALARLAATREDVRLSVLNTLESLVCRHPATPWQQAAAQWWPQLAPLPRGWLLGAIARTGCPYADRLLYEALMMGDEGASLALLDALPRDYELTFPTLDQLHRWMLRPTTSLGLRAGAAQFLARSGPATQQVQTSHEVATPAHLAADRFQPALPVEGGQTAQPARAAGATSSQPGSSLPWGELLLLVAVAMSGACVWKVARGQQGKAIWALPPLVLVPPLLLAGLTAPGLETGAVEPHRRPGAPNWVVLRAALWGWLQQPPGSDGTVSPFIYQHPSASAEVKDGQAFEQLRLRAGRAEELVLVEQAPDRAEVWLLLGQDRVARGELSLGPGTLLVLDYEHAGVESMAKEQWETYLAGHPTAVGEGTPIAAAPLASTPSNTPHPWLLLIRVLAALVASGLTILVAWRGFWRVTRLDQPRTSERQVRRAAGTWKPYPKHVKKQLLEIQEGP